MVFVRYHTMPRVIQCHESFRLHQLHWQGPSLLSGSKLVDFFSKRFLAFTGLSNKQNQQALQYYASVGGLDAAAFLFLLSSYMCKQLLYRCLISSHRMITKQNICLPLHGRRQGPFPHGWEAIHLGNSDTADEYNEKKIYSLQPHILSLQILLLRSCRIRMIPKRGTQAKSTFTFPYSPLPSLFARVYSMEFWIVFVSKTAPHKPLFI